MIVVLGTGRSGTSLVAGVLAALGYDPGKELIPADKNNAKGYFEDRELEHLLTRQSPSKEQIREFLARIDHPRRLIKAPALADYLPIVFPADSKFLWAHRPVEHAVRSCDIAYGAGNWIGARLPTRYKAIAEYLMNRAHLRVEYDLALTAPEATVRMIAGFLGCPPTSEALSFISPELPTLGPSHTRPEVETNLSSPDNHSSWRSIVSYHSYGKSNKHD